MLEVDVERAALNARQDVRSALGERVQELRPVTVGASQTREQPLGRQTMRDTLLNVGLQKLHQAEIPAQKPSAAFETSRVQTAAASP